MVKVYRGESSNNNPNVKPQDSVHDYGAGLYLTRDQGLAKQYAADRVTDVGGKPVILEGDVSLGRTLTLGSDFDAFLDRPSAPKGLPPLPGTPTPRQQITKAPSTYRKYFNLYVEMNGINVAAYDSIEGPELHRGGTQICILNKGGKPSTLGQQAARSLVPTDRAPGSLGKAWQGPGGTPGFNTSTITNIANAVELLQNYAQTWSMINEFAEAWADFLDHEDDVRREQQLGPEYPVYVRFSWIVHWENVPQMPKQWEYLGLEIKNGGGGKPYAQWAGNARSYLMTIPQLVIGKPKPPPPQAPGTWRDLFTTVMGALTTTHTEGADPQRAARLLNGYAMYDVLPILSELLRINGPMFNKVEQALYWSGTNVGTERLQIAFTAVRLKPNGPTAMTNFKVACPQAANLPKDQQENIAQFLEGSKPALASPAGEWNVRVGGKWHWIYKFDGYGNVSWRDPYNGMNGKGTYYAGKEQMQITWLHTMSRDYWKLPLDPQSQVGKAAMDEATYALTAVKV